MKLAVDLALRDSVWLYEPVPDVPWGKGGIDDWGWTTHKPSPPPASRPSASSPEPPKE